MTFSASDSNESKYAAELYPDIAAVASIYGDPYDKYVAYLKEKEPDYASNPYFLFNQPLEGGDIVSDANGGNTQAGTNVANAAPDGYGNNRWMGLWASGMVGTAMCMFWV